MKKTKSGKIKSPVRKVASTGRWKPPRLRKTVAVVTGASRGLGRAIALVLGQCGATVYVTGRTTRAAQSTDHWPGTIDDTADEVTARGGVGIAVRCDHTVDADVEALFARVGQEQGRLDLLVANAWGGYESMENFVTPFWEQPLSRWNVMFTAGVRSHYVAAWHAARLMLPHRRGLIVLTSFWDRNKTFQPLSYGLSKFANNRMAYAMSLELRPHLIAAVALSPGFMRTEKVLAACRTDEAHWRDVPGLRETESPEYSGRGVAHLAADRDVLDRTGRTLTTGQLARDYSFDDIDGRRPPPFRIPKTHLLD